MFPNPLFLKFNFLKEKGDFSGHDIMRLVVKVSHVHINS